MLYCGPFLPPPSVPLLTLADPRRPSHPRIQTDSLPPDRYCLTQVSISSVQVSDTQPASTDSVTTHGWRNNWRKCVLFCPQRVRGRACQWNNRGPDRHSVLLAVCSVDTLVICSVAPGSLFQMVSLPLKKASLVSILALQPNACIIYYKLIMMSFQKRSFPKRGPPCGRRLLSWWPPRQRAADDGPAESPPKEDNRRARGRRPSQRLARGETWSFFNY